MKKSLLPLALVALLTACGDDASDDDSKPANPGSEDAGTVKTDSSAGDASKPSPTPDATTPGNTPDAETPTGTGNDAQVPPTGTGDDAQVPVQPTQAELDAKTVADLQNLYKTCKTFKGTTKFSSDFFAIRDSYERCAANCLLTNGCDEADGAFCSRGGPTAGAKLTACFAACSPTPADGFDCGDGKKIAHTYVCDGNLTSEAELRCTNNSDEANCAMFTCKNGSVIPERLVCDGAPQCGDASDETAGCLTFCAP